MYSAGRLVCDEDDADIVIRKGENRRRCQNHVLYDKP